MFDGLTIEASQHHRGHADAAVVEEAGERGPPLEAVGDGLGQVRLRRQLLTLCDEPDLEFVDQRTEMSLANGEPLGGRPAVDLALDGEEGVDPRDRFRGDRCLGDLGEVEQLASRMGEASGLDDRSRVAAGLVEAVEPA